MPDDDKRPDDQRPIAYLREWFRDPLFWRGVVEKTFVALAALIFGYLASRILGLTKDPDTRDYVFLTGFALFMLVVMVFIYRATKVYANMGNRSYGIFMFFVFALYAAFLLSGAIALLFEPDWLVK